MATRPLVSLVAGAICLASAGLPAAAQDASRRITVVLPSEPRDLDPCNITSSAMGLVLRQNVVESLVTLDPNDSSVRPGLAAEWKEVQPGTLRLTLRKGVKFHDGTDLTAAAAAQAINRQAKPELLCTSRTKLPNTKITTKVIDEVTLEVESNPPEPLLPVFLTFVGISAPSTPETISRAPIGTGPFIFRVWEPTQQIRVDRFDGHWGPKPDVEGVRYVWRRESALRAAMVDTGEADMAIDLAPQDGTDPKRDFSYANGETTRVRFSNKPPLDDIRVRKALNLGLDRQAVVGTLLSKDVVPATQMMLPKVNGYNPELKQWPYDTAAAKKLIAEARAAGAPIDRPIRLVGRVGYFANSEEVLQAVAQMWTQLGLNVKLEMMENAQWNRLANKPWDEAARPPLMINTMHDNNSGDAAFTLYFSYHSKGTQSEFSNPKLDEVVEKAGAASGEERRTYYRQAGKIVAEEMVPEAVLFHMVSVMRVSPRLAFRPSAAVYSGMLEIAPVKFAR